MVHSFETMEINNPATLHNNPDDLNLQHQCCWYLTSCTLLTSAGAL